MPPTKKRPRSNSDSRRHGSHKLNGNRAVTPSTSTDATSTNNKKITKVTKRIIDEFPSWEKMQMFGPDSIKVVNDGIEIKTKDKLWYKLKNFKDVLELGESQNKPDEWIFDILYGCACEHCATKELAGKNYDKRRRARNFFHMTLGIATQVEDPMGLFIFNLLAVKDYRLTTSTKASFCFQQGVVDEVASELKSALHDNQTSISDDIYVFWLPELFRRMKGFNHTNEVELELPYCAGIQIDSPFVKFGEIKSLLQRVECSLIEPECSSVLSPLCGEHSRPSTTSQELQERDKPPNQPVQPECSSGTSPQYDEHSRPPTASKELQGWDDILSQLISHECFAISSPLHDKYYMPFTISKELQEKALEAGRLQEECNRLETGLHLGREYQFIEAKWGKLHDAVRDQTLKDLTCSRMVRKRVATTALSTIPMAQYRLQMAIFKSPYRLHQKR
ncbi:hypothetical protein BKA56DRAFT_243201 [Ilyonectria sp. MPI-CAGE-AT-0026]|nr:hypothetical protein BKA56DRAFT_243201 [Ilyonectria sp. MPI-CAGE-AT-0026]